jgi:hypothetical protein
MMEPLRVELLLVPDCPNGEPASRALHAALVCLGLGDVAVQTVVVSTDKEARIWDFPGSPTFRLDGRDIFDVDQPSALSCRLYPGQGAIPNHSDLTAALRRAFTSRGEPKIST